MPSHRIYAKLTVAQARVARQALEFLLDDEPDNETARAAHRKIDETIAKQEARRAG